MVAQVVLTARNRSRRRWNLLDLVCVVWVRRRVLILLGFTWAHLAYANNPLGQRLALFPVDEALHDHLLRLRRPGAVHALDDGGGAGHVLDQPADPDPLLRGDVGAGAEVLANEGRHPRVLELSLGRHRG